MELDHTTCYRALATRDARFDGLFFVGVTTTRIYCRPICPARTPGAGRCRFFPSAAAAERAGFRPCLRCRPELAPGRSPAEASGRVARLAAARIEAGALDNGGSLADLAAEFGLCERQLRRVVGREFGVAPVRLAQTRRLLLAKQLLTETNLPIIEVAFASGFESLRRFNALFRSHYRLAPGQLRRSNGRAPAGEPLRLRLGYRPPLAWDDMLGFLDDHAMAGVEVVAGDAYARTVEVGSHKGWVRVAPGSKANTLAVECAPTLAPAIGTVLARLKQLFDLGARPEAIAAHLGADPLLADAVAGNPGLRVPGTLDGFGLAWRTILGQRISVRAATTVAGRLVAAFGTTIETPIPGLDRLAPTPASIADACVDTLAPLGMTRDRALSILALARAVADGRLRLEPGADPEETIDRLRSLPGVGDWTAQMIAMRALGWPDAFPVGDLGLRRGLGEPSPAQALTLAERWRPWRSYAVMHIWYGLYLPATRAAR